MARKIKVTATVPANKIYQLATLAPSQEQTTPPQEQTTPPQQPTTPSQKQTTPLQQQTTPTTPSQEQHPTPPQQQTITTTSPTTDQPVTKVVRTSGIPLIPYQIEHSKVPKTQCRMRIDMTDPKYDAVHAFPQMGQSNYDESLGSYWETDLTSRTRIMQEVDWDDVVITVTLRHGRSIIPEKIRVDVFTPYEWIDDKVGLHRDACPFVLMSRNVWDPSNKEYVSVFTCIKTYTRHGRIGALSITYLSIPWSINKYSKPIDPSATTTKEPYFMRQDLKRMDKLVRKMVKKVDFQIIKKAMPVTITLPKTIPGSVPNTSSDPAPNTSSDSVPNTSSDSVPNTSSDSVPKTSSDSTQKAIPFGAFPYPTRNTPRYNPTWKIDSKSETDSHGSSSETDSETGSESGSETGSESGSETSSESGSETSSESESCTSRKRSHGCDDHPKKKIKH